jgi:hypothetical protein
MSENTFNAALRAMGFDSATTSGDGFRAMARPVLDECWLPPRFHRTPIGACGTRSERARLQPYRTPSRAQEDDAGLGGYLDALKADASGKVVPFKQKIA